MKKFVSTGIALASVVSLVGMSVYAAKNYTSKDLVDLGDALLGRGPLLEGQDVTGDGVVNVFDLIAMRDAMSHTGVFTETQALPTEENVRYIGRNYLDDSGLWLLHSGSAAEFTVSGKNAEVTIVGDGSENNDANYRPRYAILVNDEVILDETLSVSEKTVKLFDDGEDHTARVKVIHLSEANNGAIGLKSVKVTSDAVKPVSPTKKKDLQIEFIGDSITCAYGVEGENQYENFKTTTENFMKSYAYLTAEALDADYSAVSYSGYGIVSGYTSSGEINTESLVPSYYTQYSKSNTAKWDFKDHHTDVVVINLGTNDNTYLSVDYENRGPSYTEAYLDFLKVVRENNPDAYIICTVGVMGCAEVYPYLEEAVSQFRTETGDKKISSFLAETHSASDGYGSDWHPSEVSQQKFAYTMADKISKAIGIESSEMGVNVAAGLEYKLTETEGTQGFGFYSDWNNSYHYNVVNGGSSADAITVSLSDFALKAGAKYRISFQAEATDGAELPVYVKSGTENIYKGKYTGTGTGSKVTYTDTFTVDEAKKNCSVVFGIGGSDGLSYGIEAVSVVRIA